MAFYKRSLFLINPKFQIRFSLIICSLVFISSLVYPLIIYDLVNEVASASPELMKKFMAFKLEFILFMGLVQCLFTLIVFVLSIFLTHKIAGPLYKLKNHFSAIRHGEEISGLTFRSGDYFHDVAEEISLFLESISSKRENDQQYLEEISAFVDNLSTVIPDDKKPVLSEISRRLIDMNSHYKKNL